MNGHDKIPYGVLMLAMHAPFDSNGQPPIKLYSVYEWPVVWAMGVIEAAKDAGLESEAENDG